MLDEYVLELKDITTTRVMMQNYCDTPKLFEVACLTLTIYEGLGPFVKDGFPDLLPHGVCSCAQ